MSFAFKKFSFFQQQEQKTHGFPNNASCHCFGAGNLFVGCDNGAVQILDETFASESAFAAHGHKVLFIRVLEDKNLLVSLGVEEPGITTATLKVWELDKVHTANPTPVKALRVFNSRFPESEVTALAVHATSVSKLTAAIGLGSGTVYVIQGEATVRGRLHHLNRLTARPEHSDLWCVQGLEFSVVEGETDPSGLFVVTESQTLLFTLADQAKTVLDQQGVRAPGCCMARGGMLVVARDDALYEYTTELRGGATVFEGHKQQLLGLRRYLVVVTNDTGEEGASTSSVSVLDVKNKLVAGSATLQHVTHVVAAWGVVAALLGSGRLVVLREVALGAQLDALFKRGLYRLALDLAGAAGCDAAVEAAIHARWGDSLYAKGEYDAAMSQYLLTLGSLEPSYVIRRFLDAQRIHNLTTYLEKLHEMGLANADLTTLLLNCYTKLKDIDKLDAFVQRDSSEQQQQQQQQQQGGSGAGAAGAPPPTFDMETAYKVLRSAGYFEHALWVAYRAADVNWALDVLLEDMGAADEGLGYLEQLPRAEAAEALKKYGKALISARPEATTRLLMDLCIPGMDAAGTSYVASVADFAHLYTDRPTALMLLCEFVLVSAPAPAAEQLLYHTLLELYLTRKLIDEGGQDGGARTEGAATSRQEQNTDMLPQSRRTKALELLSGGWQPHMSSAKYNPDHVLVLCRIHAFKEGLVFIYDKMRLFREVLQVYMEWRDYAGLISSAVKYGDPATGGDLQLWADVLEYFCSQQEDCTPQLEEVLAHIEEGGVLAPLLVLQTLSRSPRLQVAVVKAYVARQLQREGADSARDRETTARLAAETAAMKREVHALKTQPRVFQNRTCAASGAPLDLPVVHFLCGHSYNLHSLGESDSECPLCAPEFRRVTEIRRNMRAAALQQDRFFAELRQHADGFSAVAEQFGRGLMNLSAAAPAP